MTGGRLRQAQGVEAPGLRSSVRGRALVLLVRLLDRLPERPLIAAAEAAGELWYRLSPARARRARHNLGVVAAALAAAGRGPARARRAASDPAALEHLVRATFRHAARYYLELARSATLARGALARLDVETPEAVEEALGGDRPVILVGAHFGALELPALYVSSRTGRPVAGPMELVVDPVLRTWFRETRAAVGIRIVPIREARRELTAAIERGESVGLVADRDLTGGGVPVPFFGRPAPLPIGPALLAIETGAPVFVGGVRRVGGGRYAGRLVPVPAPGGGTLREQVVALTTAIAAAMESIISDAPEQWWGAFHPFWPSAALGDRELGAASRRKPARVPGAAGSRAVVRADG